MRSILFALFVVTVAHSVIYVNSTDYVNGTISANETIVLVDLNITIPAIIQNHTFNVTNWPQIQAHVDAPGNISIRNVTFYADGNYTVNVTNTVYLNHTIQVNQSCEQLHINRSLGYGEKLIRGTDDGRCTFEALAPEWPNITVQTCEKLNIYTEIKPGECKEIANDSIHTIKVCGVNPEGYSYVYLKGNRSKNLSCAYVHCEGTEVPIYYPDLNKTRQNLSNCRYIVNLSDGSQACADSAATLCPSDALALSTGDIGPCFTSACDNIYSDLRSDNKELSDKLEKWQYNATEEKEEHDRCQMEQSVKFGEIWKFVAIIGIVIIIIIGWTIVKDQFGGGGPMIPPGGGDSKGVALP
jgi:ferredoxin